MKANPHRAARGRKFSGSIWSSTRDQTEMLADASIVELLDRIIRLASTHQLYARVTFDPYSMFGTDNPDRELAAAAMDSRARQDLTPRLNPQDRGYPAGASQTSAVQEAPVERSEYKDNPDVGNQPRPELVPEEQNVHADHDNYQRDHQHCDGCSSAHGLVLPLPPSPGQGQPGSGRRLTARASGWPGDTVAVCVTIWRYGGGTRNRPSESAWR